MKGRKPEINSVPEISITVSENPALEPARAADTGEIIEVPASVDMLPAARECWHLIMDNQTRFSTHEVPLIEAYCIAYAGMRQAVTNLTAEDGQLAIVYATKQGLRTNPAWKVFSEAVDKMRHLSGLLGLDTLTAERLNLTRATSASIAADLPAKIRKAAQEAMKNETV